MLAQSAAQEDPTAAVIPDVRPRALWRVAEVQAMEGFCLRVRFIDGVEGVVKMAELVQSPSAGVFGALADPGLFSQAGVLHGAVTWPGEIDLAPDAMYEAIREHGEWVLR